MSGNKFDQYKYDDASNQIWSENYKSNGENTREDTWKRAAKACASVEPEGQKHKIEKEFLNMLYNDKFIPGGRILANLGVEDKVNVTLYNCFVHNPRDINLKDCDSIDGIYDLLKAQAKTLRSEGGYGINASFIRPAGAYINGIGSRTPGVLKFMELWDKSSEILTLGSVKLLGGKKSGEKNKIRKGAQMLVLDVWHPDIEDFITCKQTKGRLTKFNMSVGITEGFMNTLLEDGMWDLKFPNTEHEKYKTEWFGDIKEWEDKGYPVVVYKQIKAQEIWDLIMKSTYNRNEPGVLFLDVANKMNPVYWFDLIKTTNPCFASDTLVATADGRNAVTIKQLAEEGKDVPVYSMNPGSGLVEIKTARNPRITGYDQKLVRVNLDDGSFIDVTPEHKFLLKNGKQIFAKDLQCGDSLPRFNKIPDKASEHSQYYYRINCDTNDITKNNIFEHRLISKFNNPELWKSKYDNEKENGWHKGGLVVHHKDYNGLNNSPENLEVMTFKEHQQFHAEHDCSGENNGNFSGNSSEEIKAHALKFTKNLGRRFSRDEWQAFAKENNLPVTFSKMHHMVLGQTPSELANICAIEIGFETNVKDTRLLKTLKEMFVQGYKAEIIGNVVFVEKTCEGCKTTFKKQHNKREIAFCSYECYTKNSMNNFYEQKAEKNKEAQARIWSQLYFDLKREPQKTEWAEVCKKEKIPVRLGGTKNGFNFYKEVAHAGQNYNHKVVSVEELEGKHTVYNLTVDNNHTVSIITKTENRKVDQPLSYTGIHVMQCGEVPMSTGVCNLGSINLVSFVKNVNDSLSFDFKSFSETVNTAIKFLDNINDISSTPLPEYKQSVLEKRRIGLGVMGLGSLHLMLGIRYGSEDSIKLVEQIFKIKSETELMASALLGKEKGSFDKFDREKYFSSYWWTNLKISDDIKKQIEEIGCMRNSHQSMNAPTGNTGIYARNVSGGIEPVFDVNGYFRWSTINEFDKRDLVDAGFKFPDVGKNEWFETEHVKFNKRGDETVLKGTFNNVNYEIDTNRGLTKESFVVDYGIKFAKEFYKDKFEDMKKSGVLASAQELSTKEHLEVLKCASHYTNMAISKTVNVPEKYPYEDFKSLYLEAWKNNLKGITTYREGTMTAVLETKTNNDKMGVKEKKLVENHAPKRPTELECDIHVMTVRGEKWTFFVGKMDGKPYEVIGGQSKYISIPKRAKTGKIVKHSAINSNVSRYDLHYDYDKGPDEEAVVKDLVNIFENATEAAFTRTVSLALRHGVPIQYVVEQITKGSEKDDDLFSFSKALSRVLKTYIVDGTKTNKTCEKCGSAQVSYQEGCKLCVACGHSRCG